MYKARASCGWGSHCGLCSDRVNVCTGFLYYDITLSSARCVLATWDIITSFFGIPAGITQLVEQWTVMQQVLD